MRVVSLKEELFCSGQYPALPESLSPDVRDLVGRMLVVDPEARINIDEITTHGWYMPPAGGGIGSCIKVRFIKIL